MGVGKQWMDEDLCVFGWWLRWFVVDDNHVGIIYGEDVSLYPPSKPL